MTLQPLGSRLLISPTTTEFEKSEGGIEVSTDLDTGIIVAVSEEYSHIFKVDDKVLYSKGAGQAQPYKGKVCLWIDARSPNNGGDCWSIISKDEK